MLKEKFQKAKNFVKEHKCQLFYFLSATFTNTIMREYIIKKRRGRGTDRGSYENSEKGVARNTYSLMKYIIKGVVIMSKFKEFKQKVKDNKGKIITSLLVIGGVTFVIVKQNNTIKQLKISDAKHSKDIAVLKSVMNENVLSSLKASLTRKLRYAEGKLNNALVKGSGITEADKMLRLEEIEFYSKELEKITEAEKLLK